MGYSVVLFASDIDDAAYSHESTKKIGIRNSR